MREEQNKEATIVANRTSVESGLAKRLVNLFNIVTELNVESMLVSQMFKPKEIEEHLQSEKDATERLNLVLKHIWIVLEYITKNGMSYNNLSNSIPYRYGNTHSDSIEGYGNNVHEIIANKLEQQKHMDIIEKLADNIAPKVSSKFKEMTEEEREVAVRKLLKNAIEETSSFENDDKYKEMKNMLDDVNFDGLAETARAMDTSNDVPPEGRR